MDTYAEKSRLILTEVHRFSIPVAQTNKLREVIDAKKLPLSSTPAGQSWCLKALHPSDPVNDVVGIPDEESIPTVQQNNQSTFVFSPPASSATSWQFDALFFPHPVIQGFVYLSDYSGTHLQQITLLNPMWATDGTYATGFQNFQLAVSKYRLMYQAVTGYHDSSAVANEGTISVAQYAQMPLSLTGMLGTAAVTATAQVSHVIEAWPEPVRTFTQLQSMPNAYFGVARDGIYAPYKLSREFKTWRDARNPSVYMQTSSVSSIFPDGATSYTNTSGALPTGAPVVNFPYGLHSVYSSSGNVAGEQVVPRADTNVIHVSARNLDLTANFTMYVRQGWEYSVIPGSPMCTFQKISPPLDETAIRAYFAIARELKDAYPAEFNDLGTILKEIGSVALDVLPTIFPPLSPFISAGKAAYKLLNGSGGGKLLNEGKERAKSMVSASALQQAKSKIADRAVARAAPAVHFPQGSMSRKTTQPGMASISKKNSATRTPEKRARLRIVRPQQRSLHDRVFGIH